MTNVLELSSEDTTQPLYALALPYGATISEVSAELQTEFLQNQLQAIQALVNQAQQNQCDDNLEVENTIETVDTIEEGVEEEATWAIPLGSAGESALNIHGLDVTQSQSILNGISNEIQNIEYLIEEDGQDHIETLEHNKECDTSYMISLNGKQYGFKLVPTSGNNGLHRSQLKILLNADSPNETISVDQSNALSTIEVSQDPQRACDDEISDIAVIVQAYKCKECYFTVEDKHLLMEHYRTEHVENISKVKEETSMDLENIPYKLDEIEVKSEQLLYMCGQCSQGYISIEECRIHMIKDHKLTGKSSDSDIPAEFKSKYGENEINLSTKFEGNVDDKKESHWLLYKSIKELKAALIADWKIKCAFNNCAHRFKDNESLEKHLKCHMTVSKNFSCSECNKEFFNWRTCSVHLFRDHLIDVDMLACPICKNYKTPTTVKLSHHMKIHSLFKSYVCGECGKAFKQPGQLHNHKVLHFARKKTQLQRWYTAKNCEICSKSFSNSKCLKKHIQAIHSKIRPFICNVCGHSCSRKAMLQMHLRQHTGEKPYACTECDYRTSDHNTLRRHMMRHTGVRPYRCPYCPYAAIQSCSFKIHMKRKHRDKPGIYACKECPFKTVNKNIYESHISGHERGLIDRYKCNKTNSMDWKLNAESENARDVYSHDPSTSRSIYHNLRNGILGSPHDDAVFLQVSTIDSEDDDTQHCFLIRNQNIDNSEETIDTGGVTIPADIEINVSSV